MAAPMSTAARWSTPGRRSDRVPRSARTATSPAGSGSAACSSRCRPSPSSSRTIALSARAAVVEGVVVEEGAVLAMGTFIGATTKIVDRDTGEIRMGRVPAYSVVVPDALLGKPLPDGRPGPSLYCAVIVKTVDEGTRARTSINELLRE